MAGYSVNRIPEGWRLFVSTVPAVWTYNGAAPTVNALVSKYSGEGSIEYTAEVNDYLALNDDGFNGLSTELSVVPDDFEDSVLGFVWVKSDTPIVVDFTMRILSTPGTVSTSITAEQSQSFAISSAEWTLLNLDTLPVIPDDLTYCVSLEIKVTSIDGASSCVLNISHPVVYCKVDFFKNPAILDILKQLPEFIREADQNQFPHPYQLARFIEMASIHTGELVDLVNGFVYQDISEGKNVNDTTTLSTLVDPSAVLRQYMFWLGQFSGTKLINPTTGLTPWENLPPTWDGLDLLDTVDDDLVAWETLESSATEPAGLVAFLRWQISTGYYGVNAGTLQAMIDAVKRVLTGTKDVEVIVTAPFDWTMTVQTIITETPDTSTLSVGASSPEMLELIEPTRPLGFKVIHELVAS